MKTSGSNSERQINPNPEKDLFANYEFDLSFLELPKGEQSKYIVEAHPNQVVGSVHNLLNRFLPRYFQYFTYVSNQGVGPKAEQEQIKNKANKYEILNQLNQLFWRFSKLNEDYRLLPVQQHEFAQAAAAIETAVTYFYAGQGTFAHEIEASVQQPSNR